MAPPAQPLLLDRAELEPLLATLRSLGYRLLGPRVRDDSIVIDEIGAVADLPIGWGDAQAGAEYRLRRRDDEALFGFTAGQHSWKELFLPPTLRLGVAMREEGGWRTLEEHREAERLALFGVRPCDLQAILIQDRVLLEGRYPDPLYRARRERALVVAVNCLEPGGTCFCASMGTGPRAAGGFDLALTELLGGGRHLFLVEVGSPRGAEVLTAVPHRPASPGEGDWAASALARAAGRMGREMETAGIKELLYRHGEHPRWDDVAARCLACTNCTLVCPTCFCTTVEERTDLAGERAERWRRWDSCFTLDFSYLHGGSVRRSVRSRYRQWLTHKLASWWDQFGTSGCVGCGRCITWCPVGIDLTEEVRAIRDSETAAAAAARGGEERHADS